MLRIAGQAFRSEAMIAPGMGTIETGKYADLLIVDGNPLDDPSALGNVVMVLKEGEIVVDNR